ncbi:MAG: DNA translocase FtsK 4TM domain-containing protein, partial [Actinomycetota bacterium]
MVRKRKKTRRAAPIRKRPAVKKPRRRNGYDLKRLRELSGLALAAAAVFLTLVLYLGWSGGLIGTWAESLLGYCFGALAILAPPVLMLAGAFLIFPEMPRGPRGLQLGAALLLAALFLMAGANDFSLLGSEPAHTNFFTSDNFKERGGIVGEALYWCTGSLLGDVGSSVVALFLLLASAFLISGASVRIVLIKSGAGARRAAMSAGRTTRRLSRSLAERRQTLVRSEAAGMGAGGAIAAGAGGGSVPFGVDPAAAERPALGENIFTGDSEGEAPLNGAKTYPDIYGKEGQSLALVETAGGEAGSVSAPTNRPATALKEAPLQEELFPIEDSVTGATAAEYIRPEPELLRKSGGAVENAGEGHDRISRVLVETLATFGVEAKVIGTVDGPRVTRYELQLAPGIKVSTVTKLKDDIAYALATTDIRILAPIPGKSAVGVEVPNPNPNLVTLGDIYRDFPSGSRPLMVWLGKGIDGKPVYA